MDYFRIVYQNNRFEAYQSKTPVGRAIQVSTQHMLPVGSPKRVLARFDDLKTVVEQLYPEVTSEGLTANAFMAHDLAKDGLTNMVHFYLIPTK